MRLCSGATILLLILTSACTSPSSLKKREGLRTPPIHQETGSEAAREILARHECTRSLAKADDLASTIDEEVSAIRSILADCSERHDAAQKEKSELLKQDARLLAQFQEARDGLRDVERTIIQESRDLERAFKESPELARVRGQIKAICRQRIELNRTLASVEETLGRLAYARATTEKRLKVLRTAERALGAVPPPPVPE